MYIFIGGLGFTEYKKLEFNNNIGSEKSVGIRGLIKVGLFLTDETSKLLSEKELIKNIQQISNKELKTYMESFKNYQLERIPFREKYPKRMQKIAEEILLDRGIIIVDLGNGNVATGRGKKEK